MLKPVTLRTGYLGKIELRLVKRGDSHFGLADGKVITEGNDADDVWQELYKSAGRSKVNYFGFDGARKKFLSYFPGGFPSKEYSAHERDYKLASKAKLEEIATPEAALSATGLGPRISSVVSSNNMISPFEKMRVRDALASPHADAFIKGAARFALEGTQSALLQMEVALKPYYAAKWTVVTFLPFLWQPEEHMYLKPEVTKSFAERVGHPYADVYSPRLDLKVYESLQELTDQTAEAISELQPRDRIDIQSFIWVIGGSYDT
ncbi:hypothetical protein B5K03_21510 [Rhizobium phaseoli]|uniref:hypothetical protein n=1 Tax=Rhizobium phaseoli TaxID=396 RepID=UPI000D68003E|nr:hypothetical protein [Rhizobium phaseoli]PWI52068.1 hypothetical protein B5K03_21510 [Rhizobium phaseoli]